jgi:hypothetical protein
LENLKGRECLGESDANGRIILKVDHVDASIPSK